MLTELEGVQITLHSVLSRPSIRKVNIPKLCGKAKISRKTFYLRYGKINNCIEAYILFELREELRKNKKGSLNQLLNALCEYVQKNKQYFYNAYHLSEQGYVCGKVKEHFFKYVRSYAYKRGSFSELILKRLTSLLYDRICSWISHGCNKSYSFLLEELAIIIELIDFQKQICSHKLQVFNFSRYYLSSD